MSNQLLLRRRAMLGQSKEITLYGIPPISITGKRNLLSVKAFGECVQSGTPIPDNPIDIVCNNGVLKVDVQGNVYTDGNVETIIITPGGSTATAEMLLKVGNYQDVQSILDGVVTRNVGVIVLDGTENFQGGQSSEVRCISITKGDLGISSATLHIDSLDLICTHYKVVNASDWNQSNLNTIRVGGGYLFFNTQYVQDNTSFKTFLADQYAAGTPVIMVFPLAAPTAEQVAGQTLALTSGTNIIDITQTSLQGLELEVKAK